MIIAYNTRPFARYIDPGNVRYVMVAFLDTILAITLLAPLKAFLRHVGVIKSSDIKVRGGTIESAE